MTQGNSGKGATDRWVETTHHRWREGEDVRSGYSFTLELEDPDDWHVFVNWRLVDGLAMPIGIEIHSSRDAHREGDSWHEWDRPKPVNRELTKKLPVGEILAQGRIQISGLWDTKTQRLADNPEVAHVGRVLRDDKGKRTRSAVDQDIRLTADVYLQVQADRARGLVGRNVAQETRARLERDHGLVVSDGRTRKWIAEAGSRGYLDELDRAGTVTSKRTRTTDGPTAIARR